LCPSSRPWQEERVKLHENEVLKKRKEWSSLTGRGLTEAQLKIQVGSDGSVPSMKRMSGWM
jgi:hypothetical protein